MTSELTKRTPGQQLARDLQDLSQRYDQHTSQLDSVRQHNRELKQQLQQQDELQETINNLNQEVGDLRLRLSHSHARGGTETSAFGAGDTGLGGGVGGMTARAKRSLATELGDGLDDEDDEEEQEAAIGGREEHVQGEDGVTTIYHTTTVRRVVVSLRISASRFEPERPC
jgi:DNA repair exonuclease SbcCD ATPase subunit